MCVSGKGDHMWNNYVKEVDDFLYSTEPNRGAALFREIEGKIMNELQFILQERKSKERRRRLTSQKYLTMLIDATVRTFEGKGADTDEAARVGLVDEEENLLDFPAESIIHRRRRLEEAVAPVASANVTQLKLDLEHEKEQYFGTEDQADRVYVYLAADNERVKEAFAEYLLGHHNISVMRVRTGDIIVHAKNTGNSFLAMGFFLPFFLMACYLDFMS
jgi:hypothetical protein